VCCFEPHRAISAVNSLLPLCCIVAVNVVHSLLTLTLILDTHSCHSPSLSTFTLLPTPCRLLPGVEDVAKNVADPECRSVASKAHATLLKVGADGKVTGIVANEAEVLAVLGSAVAKVDGQVGEVVVKYVASMMCGLINASQYKDEQWIEVSSCCLPRSLSAIRFAAAAVLQRPVLPSGSLLPPAAAWHVLVHSNLVMAV